MGFCVVYYICFCFPVGISCGGCGVPGIPVPLYRDEVGVLFLGVIILGFSLGASDKRKGGLCGGPLIGNVNLFHFWRLKWCAWGRFVIGAYSGATILLPGMYNVQRFLS